VAPPTPERLDPLQRLFVELEDAVNVNTHQIVVIRGHLQLAYLREAIDRAARAFALCRSGLSADGTRLRPDRWAPADIPCRHHTFPGTLSLTDVSLRRHLMRLSEEHPIRWRAQPPMQVFYLTDASGARSALMVNCHHGMADARSDELLLTRMMRTYAALAGTGPAIDASDAPESHPYVSYREIEAGVRPPRRRAGLTVAALLGLARDLVIGGAGVRCRGSSEAGRTIDFVYHELDAGMDGAVRGISRGSGQTINTVIAAALYRVASRSHPRPVAIRIACPVSLRPLVDARHRENAQNLTVPCSLALRSGYASTGDLLTAIAGQMADIRQGRIFTQVDRLRLFLRLGAPLRRRLGPLATGSNACYSNPGRVGERLESGGPGEVDILQYVPLGCLVPPHDFILYTPEFRGRLYLNVIYRRSAFPDVDAALLRPLRAVLREMTEEVGALGARGRPAGGGAT
jgi:hypothetical protein